MLSELLNKLIDARSDETDKYGLVVFDKSNWTIEYTEEERTYIFRNDDKFFRPYMCGSSLWGACVGTSDYIRLDWYMYDWKVQSCKEISENEYKRLFLEHCKKSEVF